MVTTTAKKLPNHQQQRFAMLKHSTLTEMQGLQPNRSPIGWRPPRTSLSYRKCPHRALSCRGIRAFFSIKLRCPQGWPHSSSGCKQLRGVCPSRASLPFLEPPLALGMTQLISSCGKHQWKQHRKCPSSSTLQLQGLTSPWPSAKPLNQVIPAWSTNPHVDASFSLFSLKNS